MQRAEETVEDLTVRLRRVAGQIRGIEHMLASGRDCRDVVTQVSAASKALEQVGFRMVAAGVERCVSDPDGSAAQGYELADLERMFLRLA